MHGDFCFIQNTPQVWEIVVTKDTNRGKWSEVLSTIVKHPNLDPPTLYSRAKPNMNSKWIHPNFQENEIYVKSWQKPTPSESHVFVSA